MDYLQMIEEQMKGLQGYTAASIIYRGSGPVEVIRGCYGWLAVNLGDVEVDVNEFPLLPRLAANTYGGFYGYMDNFRLYKGQIRIKFPTTGVGTDYRVSITQISLV